MQRKISITGRTPNKTCLKVEPKVPTTDKYNQYFCKDIVKKQMNTKLDLSPAQKMKIPFSISIPTFPTTKSLLTTDSPNKEKLPSETSQKKMIYISKIKEEDITDNTTTDPSSKEPIPETTMTEDTTAEIISETTPTHEMIPMKETEGEMIMTIGMTTEMITSMIEIEEGGGSLHRGTDTIETVAIDFFCSIRQS